MFFGSLARRRDDDPARRLLFRPGSVDVIQPQDRRQGRPRKSWKQEVSKHALAIAGAQPLINIITDEAMWKQAVNTYLSQQ